MLPPDHWAYAYIETAVAHGVLSGYADGSFLPGANVTRAQVAKMIANARSWSMDSASNNTFSDVSSDNWAYSYVEMAYAAQVMNGYADGTFRPGEFATRAQIAKIITLGLFSEPSN